MTDHSPDQLKSRLRAGRHSGFVGRARELKLIADVLEAEVLPVHLFIVHGPGGIGKTSLLGEIKRLALASGAVVARVDGRDVASTPEAFAGAVEKGFASVPDGGRRVLLVDTYEELSSLDRWLRQTYLPDLEEDILVVLAGRVPPSAGWRTDPGWRAEMRTVALRNLSPEESHLFLDGQGIEGDVQEAALLFTHGHPLALALVADHARQRPGKPFVPADAPDVVQALLTRFVQEEPDPDHRAALEAASIVRFVTEPLLASMLGGDGYRAFQWLRALHFMEEGRGGLWPHDLAREVIAADLQWRDAKRYSTLHKAARTYYTTQLMESVPEGSIHQTLANYAFIYRDNPIVQPFFAQLQETWRQSGERATTSLQEEDREALLEMTRRHEGEASEAVFAHWMNRQPQGIEVFRDAAGVAQGYLLTLQLNELNDDDYAADPGVVAAQRAVGALRQGEKALLFRFWMDAERHQRISAVQSLVFASTVRTYLTTPDLAVSLLTTVEPELWGDILGFAGLRPAPEAAFETGGVQVSVYGHDWRVEPPDAWLAALADRTPQTTAPSPVSRPNALLVLSRDAFGDAVRDALRHYAQPHNLRTSPLLRSRLVHDVAPEAREEEKIAVLKTLVSDAAEALKKAPRAAAYYRALDAAFLDPAPTQMLASERIDVPFSTFRRHLGRGVDHVIEELWQRETRP